MNKKLEQRIIRLEKALWVSHKLYHKFESFESDFDESGARAKADQMAREFAQITRMARLTPSESDNGAIVSPLHGMLSISDDEKLEDDPGARFSFEYSNSKFTIEVYPTDDTVTLLNENGEPINPKTGRALDSYSEDPLENVFPMSAWAKSKIKGVKSTKEVTAKDRELNRFLGAAYSFSPRTIADLIDQGADVNMQDSDGTTALIVAIKQGNYQVVEYLLEHGADPNLSNNRGLTPLKIANTYQKNHPHDIAGTLISYGAYE